MRACRRTAAGCEPSARSHRRGCDLLDVVYQAVELPLRTRLGLAAQPDAAYALVVPDVGDWLDVRTWPVGWSSSSCTVSTFATRLSEAAK